MSTFYLDYQNGNDANSGADWANAWKTITSGATAARIAPGDTIRIAKSPDPVSLGNATWTNLSKTVTLASALTLEVDDCDAGWTAANSSTVSHPTTTHKEGSAHVTVTKATYATSTLYAYKALAGSTDFSAYDALTFWVRNDAAIADAVRWKVCLCSDAAGTTIVDTFWVPAIPSNGQWLPVTLAKSGGGSLGAAIQSVAIYSGTSAPTNGQDLLVDNINACTYGGFSLQSLISKSSSPDYDAAGTWHGIQSIVGTTVLLDLDVNAIATSTVGYYGATETVTTYRRETIKTALASSSSTQVQALQDSGTAAGGDITYSGGWNTGSSTQDGQTFFDGLNGRGYGIYSAGKGYQTIERISCVRYAYGFAMLTQTYTDIVSAEALNNTQSGFYFDTALVSQISSAHGCGNAVAGALITTSATSGMDTVNVSGNTLYGLYLNGPSRDVFTDVSAIGNGTYGLYVYLGGGQTFVGASLDDNGIDVYSYRTGDVVLIDSSFGSASEATVTDFSNARIFSHGHDLGSYDWNFADGGTINSEATTRGGGTGKMWKLLTSSVERTSNYPLDFKVSPIALKGGETNTVSVWMSKAHATNVDGRLVCRGGQVAGIAATVTDTLANNTSWQELSLTLSPTDDCVVMIEAWAEYVAGHAAVYVDEISEVSSV